MLECLVFGHLHEFLTSDEWFICEEPFKWKRVLHACSFKVRTESNSDFSLTPNFGTDAKDNENIIRLLSRTAARCCACEINVTMLNFSVDLKKIRRL